MASALLLRPPAPELTPFVAHYWLSRNNADTQYLVRPDGCIDVVLEVGRSNWRASCYGSTTRPTALRCEPGAHYLGIRFRPGRSRHFLAARASELTDRCEDAGPLLPMAMEALADRVAGDDVFAELDRQLAALLCAAPPETHHADVMVRCIEAAHGAVRMEELARQLGRSTRQLQRLFLETVGITAKFFSTVVRAERAVQLLAAGSASLADVAVHAGYADQSHMTRDIERLTGATPARWHVAFVQDRARRTTEY